MTAAWGAAVRPARTPRRPASNAWPLAIQPHGPAPSEDIALWADSRGRATGAPGTAVVWRLGGRSLGGDPALCGHHHRTAQGLGGTLEEGRGQRVCLGRHRTSSPCSPAYSRCPPCPRGPPPRRCEVPGPSCPRWQVGQGEGLCGVRRRTGPPLSARRRCGAPSGATNLVPTDEALSWAGAVEDCRLPSATGDAALSTQPRPPSPGWALPHCPQASQSQSPPELPRAPQGSHGTHTSHPSGGHGRCTRRKDAFPGAASGRRAAAPLNVRPWPRRAPRRAPRRTTRQGRTDICARARKAAPKQTPHVSARHGRRTERALSPRAALATV